MMQMFMKLVAFGSLMYCISCSSGHIDSVEAYRAWMDDENHGIVVSRQVDDVKFRLQWQPPELMVYQDFRDDGIVCERDVRDSLVDLYNKSLSFILTIESSESQKDILWRNISTREEFTDRVHQLNFRMNEFVYLDIQGKTFRPVLHLLENDYGISHGRKVHLIFAGIPELDSTEKYTIVFEDELFMTGISQFVIYRKNMNAIPSINFWTCKAAKI